MKKFFVVLLVSLCVSLLPAGLVPNLGEARNFAVLGLETTAVTLQSANAYVTGNVGVGAGGVFNFSNGVVDGDIHLGSDVTKILGSSSLISYNTIYENQNLSGATSAAIAASAAAAALSAQPAIDITSSHTISGSGGLNVVNIGSLSLGNKQTLTLAGGPDDVFILNIIGSFSDHNGSKIVGPADRILINVLGSASKVKGQIDGTILAVQGQDITMSGTLNGCLIGGSVTVSSAVTVGSVITGVQFVPEPATLVMLALGGLLCRKFRKA
ncbi:MAG TPA: PEP-CTERM sorting domain-containing protein [Smithellaceae bacterium]|nr:PEP-CTERM sorting domain-containing protein [Smithellaceae bacterium]